MGVLNRLGSAFRKVFHLPEAIPQNEKPDPVRHTLSRGVRHAGLNIRVLRRSRAKAKRARRSRQINRRVSKR